MTQHKRRGAYSCPHCDALASVYSSNPLSKLVTEKYVQCTNLACGFQFVVTVAVDRALMPSMTPDPAIHVPLVQRRTNDIIVARAEGAPPPDAAPALPFKAIEPRPASHTHTH